MILMDTLDTFSFKCTQISEKLIIPIIQEHLSDAGDVWKSVEEARDKRETCREDFGSRIEKVNEKVMYISVASITTRLKNHAYS